MRAAAWAILAALVTTTLGPPAAANTATPAQASPRVTVTPSGNLQDGEQVQVVLSGFPAGRIHLAECPTSADAKQGGCGTQPAQQPFVDLDETGRGTGAFVVRNFASASLNVDNPRTCTVSCVLVAWDGIRLAYAPLVFRASSLPRSGLPADLLGLVSFLMLALGIAVLASGPLVRPAWHRRKARSQPLPGQPSTRESW